MLIPKYITKYTLDFRNIQNLTDTREVLTGLEKIISPHIKSGMASEQLVWVPYQPVRIPPHDGGLFVLEREWKDEVRARNFCKLVNTFIHNDPRAAFCGPWIVIAV